jgi:hypothetical protein
MFKSLAICSLVAGAAAFAPASQQKASTALRAFDDEVSLYVENMSAKSSKRNTCRNAYFVL